MWRWTVWRWVPIFLVLLMGGWFQEFAELVPFADVIGILVLLSVPASLLVDAKLRQRRGSPQ